MFGACRYKIIGSRSSERASRRMDRAFDAVTLDDVQRGRQHYRPGDLPVTGRVCLGVSSSAAGRTRRGHRSTFSHLTSDSGSNVDKVGPEATWIVRERAPELAVDGPLQVRTSNAVASVGQTKAARQPGGRACQLVFIFPDLNTGNTTYKAVQRSAQVVSVGPMLQELAKPVNDLSRGALVDDIIYTLALTAIQSRGRIAGVRRVCARLRSRGSRTSARPCSGNCCCYTTGWSLP